MVLITTCLVLLSVNYAPAQDSVEMPEIKGSHSQIYQEISVEITGIKRLPEYQRYWHKTNRPRGRKIIPEPGFEIALVQLHTKRLGENPGFFSSQLYVFDSSGKQYASDSGTFFIGTRTESKNDPKEHDYEFPVIVPKGRQFSAVQLLQFVMRETQPYVVHQKITFDISGFSW